MKKTIYAAYGSNMNIEQMKLRCPTAKVIDKGYIENYELLFRGSWNCAVATIEKKSGCRVPVVLWRLEPPDEAALDRYEGYPFLYRKESIKVKTDSKSIEAMVYIMNEGRGLGSPSSYYLEIIALGYEAAGFDKATLNEAAFKIRSINK